MMMGTQSGGENSALETAQPDPAGPQQRSWSTWILASGFAILLVVAVVAYLVIRGNDSQEAGAGLTLENTPHSRVRVGCDHPDRYTVRFRRGGGNHNH
jgi:hypothetical protein